MGAKLLIYALQPTIDTFITATMMKHLFWAFVIGINGTIVFTGYSAVAQITPDSTLPNNSNVKLENNTLNITGGTQAGANLFHSFQEFSVTTGNTAHFQNNPDIQNIISRVTGSNISNINGLIKANGAANLFLINHKGIIFGENAKLEIGGSFTATAASGVKFGDSLEFSAKNPLATPLLSVNVPIGLQYGSNPGDIEVKLANLQVNPGKTLTLTGASVNINGGKLLAPSGRVELGDTAAQTNVLLSNFAEVNVLGDNGGSIAINARSVELAGQSTLQAGIGQGLGSVDSKAFNIDINAIKDVYLKDGSRVRNTVEPDATGQAGDININTGGSLYVKSAALISASIYGKGLAGNIRINALGTVSFDGGNNTSATTVGSGINLEGIGSGGDTNITADSFSVTNGAALTSFALGSGNAGNITINAKNDVLLSNVARRERFSNASGIYTSIASPTSVGNGGDINIRAASLEVSKGARLSARTFGQGDAGNININVRKGILFDGVGLRGPSGAFTSVEPTGIGNAGNVNITSQTLRVMNGAQLFSSSKGKGAAGNLGINADFIRLDNQGAITSDTVGGRGNIDLNAKDLILHRNSNITTNATGSNNIGGNIKINTINLVGIPEDNSDISANSIDFRGGNVTINTTGLFGLQFRDAPTNMSDITASGANSQLNGTVRINRPEVDPTSGLIELPVNIVDHSYLIAQSCPVKRGNTFIITGRGGLPVSPNAMLRNNQTASIDWVTTNDLVSNQKDTNYKEQLIKPEISEADNWVISNSGEVMLIASASKDIHGHFISSAVCPL
ncbi:hypothetical protein DSM106972_001870 [Dulcicalothrix desertica PCC 7102]|uniref:Filamentous haemagglutinin FhaB/tRNA nuclease CdiA-like TPS domain-containing protein n=1 Tax=Dulcicalothrix desertica PCC 7102 TaxID=232991 RepID=A0A3S1AUJ0_9CYAN|nr:filamentous hemagglutinin N-terminal domain-containing protein [Dulcicalothrix desertica]RUT09692.1 hypothetical protein DSM106972_001870 [Dulcicalothrix desertica PCC 7102]TWH50890.1 filamentous hemagglutinin family protein [Dulcicalothrix desertica PCC 7102]